MGDLRSAATVPRGFWRLSLLPASFSFLKKPERHRGHRQKASELTGFKAIAQILKDIGEGRASTGQNQVSVLDSDVVYRPIHLDLVPDRQDFFGRAYGDVLKLS